MYPLSDNREAQRSLALALALTLAAAFSVLMLNRGDARPTTIVLASTASPVLM
jgi:hypothetical protein